MRSVFVPDCVDLGLMMHVQYERVDKFSFTEGPSLYDYIRSEGGRKFENAVRI